METLEATWSLAVVVVKEARTGTDLETGAAIDDSSWVGRSGAAVKSSNSPNSSSLSSQVSSTGVEAVTDWPGRFFGVRDMVGDVNLYGCIGSCLSGTTFADVTELMMFEGTGCA